MASGKNNMPMIVGIVLVLAIAGGAMAYFSSNMKNDAPASQQVAEAGDAQSASETAPAASGSNPAQPEPSDSEIAEATAATGGEINGVKVEPGNPVVARVDGRDITRVDVTNYIKMMPPNIQQLPPAALYPLALEQVINTRLVQNKAEDSGLESDPEVKTQVSMAEQQIVRSIYVQREVDKDISESDLKAAYDDALTKMGDVSEMKASHILVDSEQKAKDIIAKLESGEDFAKLAAANSNDPSNKDSGGDLGWFTKQDMVPEFANAVFGMEKGEYTKTPIKTQFGFHVARVDDMRDRPKPSFEELKPMLQAELRRQKLEAMLAEWKNGAKIEKFDINGNPVADAAPAAGEDAVSPAAGAAPQDAPAPEAAAE